LLSADGFALRGGRRMDRGEGGECVLHAGLTEGRLEWNLESPEGV